MAQRYQIEESTIRPLVSAVTAHGSPSSPPLTPRRVPGRHMKERLCRYMSAVFPKSRAAILILLWNLIAGFTLATVILATMFAPLNHNRYSFHILVHLFLVAYGSIALLQTLCYPLGGLLADLRCGRYRTVLCSMTSVWAGYLCLCALAVAHIALDSTHGHGIKFFYGAIGGIMALFIISGFMGFQANAVQFGLDQLQDVPSHELSVFLHWFAWMDLVGILVARLLLTSWLCADKHVLAIISFKVSPCAIIVLISALLIYTCCNRHWFHREPCTHNPYGTVYRVLKFAAQHDRPLRPSAFTYSDDERPTRIEFAKQRFGGPFTTETVEDVKTFLRILAMLLAVGPIYFFHVATIYVFPLFGLHVGPHKPVNEHNHCTTQWLLLQSNNLSCVLGVILLPLYIVLVLPHVPRWFPRILYRLGLGVVLLVLSVASMAGIEVAGHMHTAAGAHNITCMFLAEYRSTHFSPTLGLSTYYLLIPNILVGIGIPLVYITILEFISAQSPHTMKGLILGVFYAIRGFFIVLGCVFTVPFAQERLWKSCDKPLNCGFYFYLMNTLWGAASIALFWAAAKWYQYRVREDRPYEHHYAEEYYTRYAATSPEQPLAHEHLISQRRDYGALHEASIQPDLLPPQDSAPQDSAPPLPSNTHTQPLTRY